MIKFILQFRDQLNRNNNCRSDLISAIKGKQFLALCVCRCFYKTQLELSASPNVDFLMGAFECVTVNKVVVF